MYLYILILINVLSPNIIKSLPPFFSIDFLFSTSSLLSPFHSSLLLTQQFIYWYDNLHPRSVSVSCSIFVTPLSMLSFLCVYLFGKPNVWGSWFEQPAKKKRCKADDCYVSWRQNLFASQLYPNWITAPASRFQVLLRENSVPDP